MTPSPLPRSTIDNPGVQYSPISPIDGFPAQYSSENTRFEALETRGSSIRRFWRNTRNATENSLHRYMNWEEEGYEPYHEYVHQLVDAGWDNLKDLDDYMSEDWEDRDLVISVLDITDEFQQMRFPDIHDELELKKFLSEESRDGVKVRLYMAEQRGHLASGVIEAFGSVLGLDPRFFQWNIFGNKHVLPPAERHRAPFTSVGFMLPKTSTSAKGDVEYFRVSIYILPDEVGDGWTGQSFVSV
jgi:hypothetical protein